VVEWDRVRGGTGIWPSGAGRDGWRLALSDHAQAALEKLRTWVETEVAPGRLMPWLPIAFGVGIVFYFTVGQEPNIWVVTAVAVICGVGALLARERPFGFPFVMAFAFVTFGFAVATWKTSLISHPVLLHGASGVEIAGFVEVREERERSDRIVVRALKVEGGRLDEAPERIRVSVRKGTAPPVGTYVTFKARLNPPLLPLRPGGYDFARDHYFQRIGASGWVLGSIKIVEAPVEQSHLLRATAAIQRLRDAIDERIRAVAPGDKGAIASARASCSSWCARSWRRCRALPTAGRSRNGPHLRRCSPPRSISHCLARRWRRSARSSWRRSC
jgi:competence protein ComEC